MMLNGQDGEDVAPTLTEDAVEYRLYVVREEGACLQRPTAPPWRVMFFCVAAAPHHSSTQQSVYRVLPFVRFAIAREAAAALVARIRGESPLFDVPAQ